MCDRTGLWIIPLSSVIVFECIIDGRDYPGPSSSIRALHISMFSDDGFCESIRNAKSQDRRGCYDTSRYFTDGGIKMISCLSVRM